MFPNYIGHRCCSRSLTSFSVIDVVPGHRRRSRSPTPFPVFLFWRTLPLLARLEFSSATISLHLCLTESFSTVISAFPIESKEILECKLRSLKSSKVLINHTIQMLVFICISADICMSKCQCYMVAILYTFRVAFFLSPPWTISITLIEN